MLIPTMGRSLVVALLLRCGNADALEKAPELQLASGTVKGSVVSDGVQQYLGVPFAEPPVGKLRWQPPVQEAVWSGVRDARHYSKACMQPKTQMIDFSGMAEDW